MSPADWQARLTPWIGSAVQVVTRGVGTYSGELKGLLSEEVQILDEEGFTTWLLGYEDIRAVWVQLTLEEEG